MYSNIINDHLKNASFKIVFKCRLYVKLSLPKNEKRNCMLSKRTRVFVCVVCLFVVFFVVYLTISPCIRSD